MAAITQLFLSQTVYPRIAGVTYSQISTYALNNPASYTYMNNNSAAGDNNNNETGTTLGSLRFVKADTGSVKYIDYIILGYDYLNNLVGGWGVAYTEGVLVQISDDDASWTTVTTTPTYASSGSTDGLVRIKIGRNCRYVRLYKSTSGYIAVLEFSLWGR